MRHAISGARNEEFMTRFIGLLWTICRAFCKMAHSRFARIRRAFCPFGLWLMEAVIKEGGRRPWQGT
jgi:hypothetical protein